MDATIDVDVVGDVGVDVVVDVVVVDVADVDIDVFDVDVFDVDVAPAVTAAPSFSSCCSWSSDTCSPCKALSLFHHVRIGTV